MEGTSLKDTVFDWIVLLLFKHSVRNVFLGKSPLLDMLDQRISSRINGDLLETEEEQDSLIVDSLHASTDTRNNTMALRIGRKMPAKMNLHSALASEALINLLSTPRSLKGILPHGVCVCNIGQHCAELQSRPRRSGSLCPICLGDRPTSALCQCQLSLSLTMVAFVVQRQQYE